MHSSLIVLPVLMLAPQAHAFCVDWQRDAKPWIESSDPFDGALVGRFQTAGDRVCDEDGFGPSPSDDSSLIGVTNETTETVRPLLVIRCEKRAGGYETRRRENRPIAPGERLVLESAMAEYDAMWETGDFATCETRYAARGEVSGRHYALRAGVAFYVIYPRSPAVPNEMPFAELTVDQRQQLD